MHGINFGSWYAIKHSDKQNPLTKNYRQFLTQSYNLRNKNVATRYDMATDTYYLSIQDKYDNEFENLAKTLNVDVYKSTQQK